MFPKSNLLFSQFVITINFNSNPKRYFEYKNKKIRDSAFWTIYWYGIFSCGGAHKNTSPITCEYTVSLVNTNKNAISAVCNAPFLIIGMCNATLSMFRTSTNKYEYTYVSMCHTPAIQYQTCLRGLYISCDVQIVNEMIINVDQSDQIWLEIFPKYKISIQIKDHVRWRILNKSTLKSPNSLQNLWRVTYRSLLWLLSEIGIVTQRGIDVVDVNIFQIHINIIPNSPAFIQRRRGGIDPDITVFLDQVQRFVGNDSVAR